MGRGILKQKKSLKRFYLSQMIKENERLNAELKAIKEDPTSVVGHFIGQFNEVIGQNQRLSALVCALLEQKGGKVVVTREEIEVFRGKRLRVNIENLEDGTKFEDAKEYTFTYKAITKEEEEAEKVAEAAAAAAQAAPECTDPNCTLPKDLKHTHPTPVPAEEAAPTTEAPVEAPVATEAATATEAS